MNTTQSKAIAEDLRKVGTTAVAAALISLFLSDARLLTGCALLIGVVFWILGIYLTED